MSTCPTPPHRARPPGLPPLNALNEGRVPADSPALPMMGYRPNALFSDGAAHARLRQAVTDSMAAVNELQLVRQPRQSADHLISQFSSEPRGQAELMGDYAQPLPLLVFSDLFGCPPEPTAHPTRPYSTPTC